MMTAYTIDLPVTPINEQSKKIEKRYHDDLFEKSVDSSAMAHVYVQQLPNVRAEQTSKPMSKRMAMLRKAGLIGCLNNSGVTSSNYKEVILESQAL